MTLIRIVKWVFRPGVLILGTAVLVVAAGLVVWPLNPGPSKPQPLPLRDEDQEVAWLYPATSTASWQRLALAVQQASDQLQETLPGLEWQHNAGSKDARLGLGVSEVALSWPSRRGRLVFRWYKLTSEWTPSAWVEALLARGRPPLAIIGGGNSYWARELAAALADATRDVPETGRPLLLFTTATADQVRDPSVVDADNPPVLPEEPGEETGIRLTDVYPNRTFRFCFTNRQMATAVTRFIWNNLDLRPDADPAHVVKWTDDAYSRDLFEGYWRVLRYRGADNVLQQMAWVTGAAGMGLPAPTLAGWVTSGFRGPQSQAGVEPWVVDSSVGSFSNPNPYEAKAVMDLLQKMGSADSPARTGGRLLLVITGQSQPSRRFLRDLARSGGPNTVRRFVVAMGDAVSFNLIYRDREVTWPIQDLPFKLVFFCHRNPIDRKAGFHRAGEGLLADRRRASGTEDLLLYRDIVAALGLAFWARGEPCDNPDALADGLRAVHQVNGHLHLRPEGVPLFDARGQRSAGTGEHVVYLRPQFEGDRIRPRAVIEVWERANDRSWREVATPLTVSYDEFEVHHGRFANE